MPSQNRVLRILIATTQSATGILGLIGNSEGNAPTRCVTERSSIRKAPASHPRLINRRRLWNSRAQPFHNSGAWHTPQSGSKIGGIVHPEMHPSHHALLLPIPPMSLQMTGRPAAKAPGLPWANSPPDRRNNQPAVASQNLPHIFCNVWPHAVTVPSNCLIDS